MWCNGFECKTTSFKVFKTCRFANEATSNFISRGCTEKNNNNACDMKQSLIADWVTDNLKYVLRKQRIIKTSS